MADSGQPGPSPTTIEHVHRGPVFAVEVMRFTDADGRAVQRDVVRHPGAVLVLPLIDDETFLMIQNYRIAPDETLWEFPAGKLESEEDPRDAGARELEEETGYSADRITELGRFYTSPGFADELMHVYLATGLTEVGQRLDPGEQITTHRVPVDEAFDMATSGELRDGKSIAALLLYRDRMERGR